MLQDARQALRLLAKHPSSAVLTIVVFALAIGANTTVFSVFSGFFLRPLPFPNDDRLTMIGVSLPKLGAADGVGTSIPLYLDWREKASTLEDAAIYAPGSRTLRSEDLPEQIEVTRASPSMLSVLGVAPAVGRAFTEEETVPGNDLVIVLSHRFWETRFGARADIVGQDVRLDDDLFRVIGVMPKGFGFPDREVDAWVPFSYGPRDVAEDQSLITLAQGVARLRSNATLDDLNTELAAIARASIERMPQFAGLAEATGYTLRARALRDHAVGDLEQRLLVLQGLVLAVLLIACANVANLQLSRMATRRKELAVRAALGAGIGRLAKLVVAEGILLAVIGALVGLALSYAGIELVRTLGLERASQGFNVQLNALVVVATFGAALVAALLSGLLPLLLLRRDDFARAVRESGRSTSGEPPTRHWRSGLVVVQIAAGLALLVGAGSLTSVFYQLKERGPGFEPAGVWSAAFGLPPARYGTGAEQARFVEQALGELRSLPGVDVAGFTTALPFSGQNEGATIIIDGYEPIAGSPPPAAQFRSIDDRYFSTLDIPVLRGRAFAVTETERVVIVDESFAQTYWPNGDALGQRVREGGDGPTDWSTIVGIVPHVKHESFRADEFGNTLYWHYTQRPATAGMFVVRTTLPTESLTQAARAAVARLDPSLALYNVLPMDVRVLRALGPERASMVLTLLFAAIAVVLAVIGVYGVLAWAVAQRVGEIGVRMALGARGADVIRMIVGQGARLIAAGLVLGTASALVLGRVLAARIPEIDAADPIVLGLAALTLVSIAMAASWFPARRAGRVDPMHALRDS